MVLATIVVISTHAQELTEIMYVANKKGIPVYEKPFPDAKIITKADYGQTVVVYDWSEEYKLDMNPTINTEGLEGCWQKIKYKNKQGYIMNTYLLPLPPPKKGTSAIKEYFKQLSPIAGMAEMKKYSYGEEKGLKTLYKNGMESYTTDYSEAYTLPHFSVQQAFLLLRLLKYKSMVKENDSLPTVESKREDGSTAWEKFIDDRSLEVEKDYGIQKIYIRYDLYQIEIYQSKEADQVIILWYEDEPGC